jgi:hypothetical protein
MPATSVRRSWRIWAICIGIAFPVESTILPSCAHGRRESLWVRIGQAALAGQPNEMLGRGNRLRQLIDPPDLSSDSRVIRVRIRLRRMRPIMLAKARKPIETSL